MGDFRKDLEFMINESQFINNKNKVRFIFRYANRLMGSIDLLDLNTRAYNSLRRNGIDTIEKISERWDDLYKLKGSGGTTVKEVKNKYIEYYYSTLKSKEEKEEFWEDTITATINI